MLYIMKLIVGLGNPWDKYKNNRHNIWFSLIEQFVEVNKIGNFSYDNKFSWEVLTGSFNSLLLDSEWEKEEKILFLKPMLFMNKSWSSVQAVSNFYKIEAKDILVIHDEIDLITGVIKMKFWGWLAGHNGLKDIAAKIWTQDFWRLRIGVDRPTSSMQVADYVLGNFKKEASEKIQDRYLDIESMIKEFLVK